MTLRHAAVAVVSLLSGMMTTHAQVPRAETGYRDALSHWSRVLARFVDESGRVDFHGLAADRADLDWFADYVSQVSPGSRPQMFTDAAQVLAYHINAYNALAMRGVLDAGIPADFDGFLKRLRFFWLRKVVIGGKATSLYDYENKVIRPLGEPRVHFALNCMVRDCPRLPREPFVAEALDAQLDAAAREFFSKQKHLRIDAAKHELWLSEILDFYTEDFTADGNPSSLITYVRQYVTEPIEDSYRVRFIPYDWTLNQQPVRKRVGGESE